MNAPYDTSDAGLSRALGRNAIFIAALGDIIGDAGYLAYGFHTGHGTSALQILGAVSAAFGQTILMAHGDGEIDLYERKGRFGHTVKTIRLASQSLTQHMPVVSRSKHPNAWGFGLLMLNGAALLAEATQQLMHNPHNPAMISQALLGLTITTGLGLFTTASSSLVKTQEPADRMFKIGATCLTGATVSNLSLCATTQEPIAKGILIILTGAFLVSSFVKFLAKAQGKAEPHKPNPAAVSSSTDAPRP